MCIARNREEVVTILKGIENLIKEQRNDIVRACREKMEDLQNRGLLTSEKHHGNYRGSEGVMIYSLGIFWRRLRSLERG